MRPLWRRRGKWCREGAAERSQIAFRTVYNTLPAMILSAVVTEAEEGGFVSYNPEAGTTSQGETFDEAIQNPSVMTCFELSNA